MQNLLIGILNAHYTPIEILPTEKAIVPLVADSQHAANVYEVHSIIEAFKLLSKLLCSYSSFTATIKGAEDQALPILLPAKQPAD